MRRFAWMNFQITTELNSKFSYTPCYVLVKNYNYEITEKIKKETYS
jgi:hypothetical protein